jgi:precorrin-3B C17-methyltransferase
MTVRAHQALREAGVIIGYKTYLDLIEPLLEGQIVEGSGMRKEVERGLRAVELAARGGNVAVISSGDPGIYGMAGVVLEAAVQRGLDSLIDIEIVPGVSAGCAAAALAGAPLMHDSAFISLSDLLTPWEVIEKRLALAAQGDFVIVLYNPRSRGRPLLIEKARSIILEYRKGNTPVAVVRNAMRNGESVALSSLEGFTRKEIDMFTVVIVGNSQSYVKNGRFITPRGYRI